MAQTLQLVDKQFIPLCTVLYIRGGAAFVHQQYHKHV